MAVISLNTLHLVRRAETVSFGVEDPHNKTLIDVVAKARMQVSVRLAHLNLIKPFLNDIIHVVPRGVDPDFHNTSFLIANQVRVVA